MMSPRTLVLDNNDSFTFNLVQLLGELGASPRVASIDEPTIPEPAAFDLLIISPGPGRPDNANVARRLLEKAAGRIPVLGVCLGHQVIATVFGGSVGPAPEPRHGKVSAIRHDGEGVFEGLPNPMEAVRYHSLCVEDPGSDLVATAWSEDDVVQAVRHPDLAVEGVQFHPESILTGMGSQLMANFLARV